MDSIPLLFINCKNMTERAGTGQGVHRQESQPKDTLAKAQEVDTQQLGWAKWAQPWEVEMNGEPHE